MEPTAISAATDTERDWCAHLMAGIEPWITLRRNLQQCLAVCHNREYLLYVAHSGGEPCGFILMHRRGLASSPYITSIAVAEAFRGQGIGARLLEFAEKLFCSEARHLFLCVSSFNPRARSFYDRHGYTAVGELKDYIIEGASEILMHKRLRQT